MFEFGNDLIKIPLQWSNVASSVRMKLWLVILVLRETKVKGPVPPYSRG